MPRKPFKSPRDWLSTQQRDAFGDQTGLGWPALTGRNGAEVRAARNQHDFVRRLRARMRSEGVTTRDLAEHAGVSVEKVRRILNGTDPLDIVYGHVLADAVTMPFHAGVPPTAPPTSHLTVGGNP